MIELMRVGSRLAPASCGVPPEGSLRMLFAGICGTDIQILRGDRKDPAEILGHEGVAWDPVDGRLVGFNPVSTSDQDRILGHSVPGILRTHVPIERNQPDPWPQLVELDRRLLEPIGVLVEPLGACLYSWDIIEAAVGIPRHVVVWGSGVMGLLNALEGTRRNVDVTLVHPKPDRLEWARRWFSSGGVTFSEEFVQEASADVALLTVPRTAMFDVIEQAVLSLRAGGLLILVGGADATHPALPGVDLHSIRRASVSGGIGAAVGALATTGRPIFVAGHRGTSEEQLVRSQATLIDGQEMYRGLITHVVRPSEVNSVLARRVAGEGTDVFGQQILKVVVDLQ